MNDLRRTGFFSPRNVPLWLGVALAIVLACLMVWRP